MKDVIIKGNVSKFTHEYERLYVNKDFVFSHHLIERDKSKPFFFIQIGAFDGVFDDPIRDYVVEYGWSGILVEPERYQFSKLIKNYDGFDGLQFVNAAVSYDRDSKILYAIDGAGAPKFVEALASFSKETILWHDQWIPDLEDRIYEEEVDCITFDDIVDMCPRKDIDLIQIDTEGFDLEVLKMIDFHKVKPHIIRFEHRHLNIKDHHLATNILVNEGYKILEEQYDTIGYLYENKVKE